MKKFLIMLMVVAMASFLFVGCLGVTPPVDDVDEDEDVSAPTSTAPVIFAIATSGDVETGIINLYSSATQYMNKTQVKDGIVVEGFAPKYSEVKVYVDNVVVATGTAYGTSEMFIVGVAKAKLGADGAKTIYATATETGLAESVPSATYAFTLDTVAPEIVEVAIEVEGLVIGDEATVTVTCSEAINEDSLVLASINIWDTFNITVSEYCFAWEGPFGYDLVSPKVIKLTADIDAVGAGGEEGNLMRVRYNVSGYTAGLEDLTTTVYVTDLAGNKLASSVHYCRVELE